MSLTEKILNKFKQKIESLELAPYGDGRFEVILDGETVFSKLEVGDFPEDDQVLSDLAS